MIRIKRDSTFVTLFYKVLNMHGKVVAVRPQALQRRKENRQAVALD
jgi:hypothetical protein